MKTGITYNKIVLQLCIIFFSVSYANAQKGFFVKFSLGSGVSIENSSLNSSSFSMFMKNHAIGYGITENFAVQLGEFGGLIKQKTKNYSYINTDAVGVGFSYRIPSNIKVSVIGAFYTKVSLAEKWTESSGEVVSEGDGYGVNLSIDKEWFIGKRWGARIGPQLYWIKTIDQNYSFYNISLNGSIVYYLKPVK